MFTCVLFVNAVLLVELIDTSVSSCRFLLSCVERMAFGTNFYVDILFCRTCYECVTAVTCNCCLIIIWMDSFSHDFHLFIFLSFSVISLPADSGFCHTIDVKVSTFKETIKNKKLRRLPFIRGVINFIESLILGMQTLMYSASFFEDDEDEKKKKEAMTQEERKAQEEKEKKQEKAMMGGTVAFSIVFALGLFFFLPYFLSGIFHKVIASDTVIALLEGLINSISCHTSC